MDFKPYLILGACNPRLAYKALSVDEAIGLLLPCNVVLKQEGNGIEVTVLDPEVMFSVVESDTKYALAGLPQEAKSRLQDALTALKNLA